MYIFDIRRFCCRCFRALLLLCVFFSIWFLFAFCICECVLEENVEAFARRSSFTHSFCHFSRIQQTNTIYVSNPILVYMAGCVVVYSFRIFYFFCDVQKNTFSHPAPFCLLLTLFAHFFLFLKLVLSLSCVEYVPL